jgi:PncC family amidohydrolase
MDFTQSLRAAGAALAKLLNEKRVHVVFAESCTAGLVAATLSEAPGISQWHCGSAVTYRETTKTAWLKISPEDISQFNVVSAQIARQMAVGVLHATPEADWAASITGHLGPQAPPALDGIVYIAVARREKSAVVEVSARRHELAAKERHPRQCEAARLVLQELSDALRSGKC